MASFVQPTSSSNNAGNVTPRPASRAQSLQDMDDTKSESAMTTTSSGTKRKRGTEPKFYAVKVGKTPGIYHSWHDCLEQVTKYKGASFKSFTTLTDAEAFMNGTPSSSANSPNPSSTPSKFYAVQSGRIPGVYTDWASAAQQIKGWTKPKHKSFATRTEAEAFVRAGQGSGGESSYTDVESEASVLDGRKGCKLGEAAPPMKRQRRSEGAAAENGVSGSEEQEYEPGTGPLPEDAEDGFDRRVILNPRTGKVDWKTDAQQNARKLQPTGESKGGILRIYTDGSSLGNGQNGAVAGVGVFFGPGDERNVSEALSGARQTNQRAELTAIQRALDIAPLHRDVNVYSDSKYAIMCVTEWFISWRRNGWLTAARKPVENKDLIELVLKRIDERNRCGAKTEFTWIKGHADDPGNSAADLLAVNGAREAREREVLAGNGVARSEPPPE